MSSMKSCLACVSILLILTMSTGCTSDDEPSNEPPVAAMSGPTWGWVNMTLAFDASNSTDDKDGLLYTWNWGDGKKDDKIGPLADHSFELPGNYKVKVTVIDKDGKENSASIEVEVRERVTVNLSSPTVTQFSRTDTCWDGLTNINALAPNDVTVTWDDISVSVRGSDGVVLVETEELNENTGVYADPATLEFWYVDIMGNEALEPGDAFKITGMNTDFEGASVSLFYLDLLIGTAKLPTDFP